jgi:S1-C subfamily serine protease
LTLSAKPGAGAEIVEIAGGSPAEHAGFQVGDIVTRIADRHAPSPAVVARVLAATPTGAYAVFVVRRGSTHSVLALERTW